MSDLTDYIIQKGGKSFTERKFNDVDNLVLCYLVYYDFTGIVPGFRKDRSGSISLHDAMKRYFAVHGLSQKNVVPGILRGAGRSRRFGDCRLSAFISPVIAKRRTQFAGIHFDLGNHLHYVAFRGIDASLFGWKEAFQMSYKVTKAQRHAVAYLQAVIRMTVKRDPEALFMVGGHSKGGNLAVFASSVCEEKYRRRIVQVYSNDGPGISLSRTLHERYEQIRYMVRKIVPEYSVFGMIFEKDLPSLIVKSSAKGINQHEPMSWLVDDDHFVTAGRNSKRSVRLRKAINRWVRRIEPEDRRVFVAELFEAIEDVGRRSQEEALGKVKRMRLVLSQTGPVTRRTLLRLLWAYWG